MCRCRKSSGAAAPKNGDPVEFGEAGLVKMVCTSGCEKVFGDYTGWVYHFDINQTIYVDKRDSVFLLRPGLDYG